MAALNLSGFSNIFPPCTAGWSSLVARRAHNPKVAGSNPAPATCSGTNAALGRRFRVLTMLVSGGRSMFKTDATQARGWTMTDSWSKLRPRAVGRSR